jgi:hypothetical protein
MEVLRQPFAFDAARLNILDYSLSNTAEMMPGSPVLLVWGRGTNQNRIYGYVYAVRPVIRKLIRQTEVVVVGIQSPMSFVTKTRDWPDMGVHNVIAEIVDDYRLTPKVLPIFQKPELKQDDVSDWQFIVDLARKSDCVVLSIRDMIVVAPIQEYWRRALKTQSRAATFRNALSPGANLVSFERDSTVVRPALDGSESPVGTDADFTRLTNKHWKGSVVGETIRKMFPQSAKARMLGPGDIYPFDVFDVTLDSGRSTWTTLQVRYVLTEEDYYADLVFGGDGNTYAHRGVFDSLDIADAIQRQAVTLSPDPVLKNFQPVYMGTQQTMRAHWESALTCSPDVQEMVWLR